LTTARHEVRSYSGFNLFQADDLNLFQAIVRGEFTISVLRNNDLQVRLNKTAGQVSRLLKRLRLHGLIKKIGRTYKYYLTRLGQAVTACALRLRQTTVLPALECKAESLVLATSVDLGHNQWFHLARCERAN